MADWMLVGRGLLLASLPCLALLYTLLWRTAGSTTVAFGCQPQYNPNSQGRGPKNEWRILVTGSAGFIGYHISHTLVEQWGSTVVGVDSYTDYYDVQLKLDRTYELMKLGVRTYRGDLCDQTMLSYLFDKYEFTHVVHMAAQAGVRHSLEKPLEYTRNNVKCFLTLLDVMKNHKNVSLVYASSSSVYGQDASLPFSISSHPHPPTNMYAALKVANERFANAYCSEHGLKAIGLRLFTVYGPWGRPDMAVYKFTERIANGRPVPVFNSSRPLLRDFTFVNDTVGGVLVALDHTPSCCGEVYNVGSGRPLTLDRMLELLEQELKLPAKIEPLPLPPSDLYSTWADISETKRILGFTPHTTLAEGLREFVRWYKDYHFERRRLEERGELVHKNKQIENFLKEGEDEIAAARGRETNKRNEEYRARLSNLRNKYSEFAKGQDREIPSLKKKGFVFFQGVDSPGATVIKAPGYQGNIKLLEQQCLKTEQCVAFNSRGEFKSHLQPRERWKETTAGEGLYVADIDMCLSDLHNCDRNADCIHAGPADFSCVCHSGYVKLGKSCVEKYVDGVVGETERMWKLSNQLDGLSWERVTDRKQFIFFQGLDSPGGDYLVVEGGGGDRVRLERVCRRTHQCVAFNTNGILKQSLHPPYKWVRWTDHPEHGLYVLDVDYCSMASEQCPRQAHCIRHSPANYSCSCDPPWMMSSDLRCKLQELSPIHVIVSVDRDHFPGLVAVINSTLSHTSRPGAIKFHIVLSDVEPQSLKEYLDCYGVDRRQLDMVQLDPSHLRGKVKVYSPVEKVGNLASLANFGRFLFHELFPELERAIYLDADTIVLGDITLFWQQLEAMDQLLLVVPRHTPTYGNMFKPKVKKLFRKRYGYEFSSSDPTFNAGVYGVNFDLWRERNFHREVLYWMQQQSQHPLWNYGTQPIMLLVAHNQWAQLDQQWNVNGLGWKTEIEAESLRRANLLHWSGKGKPWLPDGLHRHLWLPHVPRVCSGRGRCVSHGRSGYRCQCGRGYYGDQCHRSSNELL